MNEVSIKKPEVVGYIAKRDSEYDGCRLGPVCMTADSWPGSVALIRLSDYEALAAECEKLREDAERWRAISQKRELGKKYGCHCDLDEGMEPDGCVIDSGERHNCIYAKTIEVKEQCEYWRVIVTDSGVQEKSK